MNRLELQLLDDIDEAEQLHKVVVTKWRWVTVGFPVCALVMLAGCLLGGFGVAAGGFVSTLIGFPVFVGLMIFVWFFNTTPKRAGGYSKLLYRPHETAEMIRKARAKHLEYLEGQ